MAQRLTLRSSSECLPTLQRERAHAVANARSRLLRAVADWRHRYGMTDAESEVLELLGQGMPLRLIAAKRSRSIDTVRSQVIALFDKTGYRSQPALIAALGKAGDDTA